MQIILRDYVGAILGLTRDGLSWRLNPLETMRDESHSFSPVGEGNVVSIEFNQLYRWHATTSEPDAKWMENLIKTKISNKPYNQVCMHCVSINGIVCIVS
jgi:linoleate 10R-lipoxygenase